MQSENGLLCILVSASVKEGMNHDEFLWTDTMRGYMEQGMIKDSGRITCALLNTLLHRDRDVDSIKLRTMTDLVEKDGRAYSAYMENWADDVLLEHGWDPATGKPGPNAFLEEGISALDLRSYGITDDPYTDPIRLSAINSLIEEVNAKRDPAAQVPLGSDRPFRVELRSIDVVSISFDGVCAKRQKDTRDRETDTAGSIFTKDAYDGPAEYTRAPEAKKRPRTETAVAHIEVGGKKYLLAAENMFVLGKLTLAFLLYNHLLTGRQVLIFSDGGKDIKYTAENLFAFCPHTVVLDWFHLKKHCNELMSLAFYGGKKFKNWRYQTSRRLFHILFAGNVESAREFLRSIDQKTYVKDPDEFEELIDYLERKDYAIACYAVRRKLGLRISSNPVEKANDLIVAERQKGKGMSWSRFGSWALAAVSVMYLNHEEDNWYSDRPLSFKMYESYGKVFDLDKKEMCDVA